MRRLTHLSVATLAVAPLTHDRNWPLVGGMILMSMAGSVLPDYLDLRSDVRGVLRHRGLSHSLLIAASATLLAWWIMIAMTRIDDPAWALDVMSVEPLTMAFAAGIGSHLVLDACTPHGIRPLLPFSGRRLWLLPRFLRIRTGGQLDALIGLAALTSTAAMVLLRT